MQYYIISVFTCPNAVHYYYFYRSDGKILFSASIDYTVVQWSSSGTPFHTIDVCSQQIKYRTMNLITLKGHSNVHPIARVVINCVWV